MVPWNYPILMPTWKLGPALATGNSIVLKPAEQSPIVPLALAELAAEAGVPDGVLNVLPGFGETAGQALGRHMDVDKLAFTGSSEVGKLFLVYAGESNMKSVQLECGGKSPNVVFDDVPDVDLAVAQAAEGIFGNSGQVCSAGSRLLLQESIADEVLEKLAAEAGKWAPGDPLDPATRMGSMVDETQMDRVLGYIGTGTAEGAELRAGGARARAETGGFYVEPTIFAGARNDMRIAQEEIFGPVVTAIPFGSEADGVRIANDTVYGLSSARLDARHQQGPPLRARDPRRHRVHQLLRLGRQLAPVRRLQAVGHRARQVAARARELHAAQDDLHQRPGGLATRPRTRTPPAASATAAAPATAAASTNPSS